MQESLLTLMSSKCANNISSEQHERGGLCILFLKNPIFGLFESGLCHQIKRTIDYLFIKRFITSCLI